MRHFYFAYGMNTNAEQMASRCSDSKSLGAARLYGYNFAFRGHADIELADSYMDYVDGVLWDISSDDLYALDLLEGFPDYYLRQRVIATIIDKEVTAWVYTMQDQSFTRNPANQYFEMCKQGYEHFGIATEQLFNALAFENKETF